MIDECHEEIMDRRIARIASRCPGVTGYKRIDGMRTKFRIMPTRIAEALAYLAPLAEILHTGVANGFTIGVTFRMREGRGFAQWTSDMRVRMSDLEERAMCRYLIIRMPDGRFSVAGGRAMIRGAFREPDGTWHVSAQSSGAGAPHDVIIRATPEGPPGRWTFGIDPDGEVPEEAEWQTYELVPQGIRDYVAEWATGGWWE